MLRVGFKFKIRKSCILREAQICNSVRESESLNQFFLKEFVDGDEIIIIKISDNDNCHFPHEIRVEEIKTGLIGVLELTDLETQFYNYKLKLEEKAENLEISFNDMSSLLSQRYQDLFEENNLKEYLIPIEIQ